VNNKLTYLRLYLGHLFSANLLDDNDILARRNRFIGQQGCGFETNVSVSRRSREAIFKCLGLVSVSGLQRQRLVHISAVV